ncbi:NnrU family protein [Lichenicoccus sp.]|uniref:NnrU family protein n=1 Tax=Lichenicoccus sp. TaxID=2781899 RepID=UPI003D128ED9
MTTGLDLLVLAACAWVAVHVGIAGTALRGALARRIGDTGFRVLFSLLSVVAIAALVISYRSARAAGSVRLWTIPDWLGWLLVLLMAPAFVLLIGSATTPNPTAVGGERLLDREPRGLLRITRHPMLWSFATWSAVHVAGNGDLVSLLFFGAFGVTALAGMPSIDRKLATRDPAGWGRLASATSILPFGAILAGRNRLVLREIGWIAPVAGLALWVALLLSHPWLFGVSPLPY